MSITRDNLIKYGWERFVVFSKTIKYKYSLGIFLVKSILVGFDYQDNLAQIVYEEIDDDGTIFIKHLDIPDSIEELHEIVNEYGLGSFIKIEN